MIPDVRVAIEAVHRSGPDRCYLIGLMMTSMQPKRQRSRHLLRLEAGVTVIYLNSNKGYATTRGEGSRSHTDDEDLSLGSADYPRSSQRQAFLPVRTYTPRKRH